MAKNKEIVIRPPAGEIEFNIKEVWEYKDLLRELVYKNFRLIYKQTVLGPIWLIFNPIITSVVFTFVFGSFAGLETDGLPHFLFYMSGNTLWNFFANCINTNSNTFRANAGVYGKVYFPRLTIPLSHVISGFINFMMQFVSLLVFFFIYKFTGTELHIAPRMLLLPVIMLHTILLCLAVGLVLSCLTYKYRDFVFIINLGMQLWMYLTPVVYSMSNTGGWMHKVLLLNPMTPIIHNFRYALLGRGGLMIGSWAISIALTAVLLFVGIVAFNRSARNFVDTV